MKWKTIVNRGSEQGFVTALNNSGSATVAGQVVQWDFAETDKIDGFSVVDPGGSAGTLFAGIADAAVPDREKLLVQVYGIRSSVLIRATDTAVALGDIFDMASASSCLQRTAASAAQMATASNAAAAPARAVAAQSQATGSVTTTIKMFLRFLG